MTDQIFQFLQVIAMFLIPFFAALVGLFIKVAILNTRLKSLEDFKSDSEPAKDRAISELVNMNGNMKGMRADMKIIRQDIHEMKNDHNNLFALNPELRQPVKNG